MSATESESADADTDAEAESENNDEFTYYPQVTQHPTTAIEGDIVDIVTGANIDGDVEDTGSSFGVVFEDPEVVGDGTLWQNRDIPEGFTTTAEFNDTLRLAIEGTDNDYVRGQEVTDEKVERAREAIAGHMDIDLAEVEDLEYDDEKVKGTDFKVADPTDRDADVQEVDGNTLGIDVGGGVFSSTEADGFGDADRIMVWYGGMSGQFVGRGLDFNGMPFARYTNADDDEAAYLVKGLFQVPIGWRGDTDVEEYGEVPTTDRSKLATDLGRPPRVARPPVLRDDIDGRAFIAIGRYNGGNMHEVHIGRAEDDYDEFLATLRDNSEPDYDGFDMKYDQDADETLAAEFDSDGIYALYHGEGWQDEPEETQGWGDGGDSSNGGSFDTPDVDVDSDSVDHPTAQEVEFAEGIAEKIAGTGVSPDDAIFPVEGEDENTDLAGVVAANDDQFQVDPDVESIREVVYENTAHLNIEEL